MLEESDWQIHDPFSVAVFLLPESQDFESTALYISRHLELDFPESCALIHESRIIWVVNNHMEQLEQLQNKKNNFLASIPLIVREFNCKAGIAAPCSNFLDLPLAAVQAKAALRLGQKHDPDLGYYHFSAYTLDYIIDRIDGELPGECYYHPGLLSLLAYDQKHGTDFLKTLRCYIDANYNMAIAAERHFLHRATLYRRMERIQEITGINIENSNELLHISISLKLLGEKKGIKPQV
jgi:sugar diacid utilization regulator